MDHQLAEYLPHAVQSPLILVAQSPIDSGVDCTRERDGRAAGPASWAIGSARSTITSGSTNPIFAAKYAEQASQTLMRG